MNFIRDDILKIQNFCQSIIEKPRPINAQPHKQENGSMWCEDWELIEICKYFYNGRDFYYQDPPPNRLKKNKIWPGKDFIAQEAEKVCAECSGNMDRIVEALKRRRDDNTSG